MSYTVNLGLKSAIDNFSWGDTENINLALQDLNSIIKTISANIIGASQLRPVIEEKEEKKFALVDICYFIVQDQDEQLKKTNPTARAREQMINEASFSEKAILKRCFTDLTQVFQKIEQADLKSITLLFGIKAISDLSSTKILVVLPSKADEIEVNLNKLIALRSRYDINKVSEAEKVLLSNVDKKINEEKEKLERLRSNTLDFNSFEDNIHLSKETA